MAGLAFLSGLLGADGRFPKARRGRVYCVIQRGDFGVSGLSALSQEIELIFQRKKLFLGTFSAKKAAAIARLPMRFFFSRQKPGGF